MEKHTFSINKQHEHFKRLQAVARILAAGAILLAQKKAATEDLKGKQNVERTVKIS